MEKLFTTEKDKIFRNKGILNPFYVPDFLPGREEELKKIAWNLSPCLKGEIPNNVFLYGKSGVGKTACVKKVLQALKTKLKSLGIKNVKMMYFNCSTTQVETEIVAKIINFFSKKLKVPERGFGPGKYYDIFSQTLDKESGIFILVLDKIDKLAKSKNLLYNLSGANEHLLLTARLSIIGISNRLKFADNLDERILSRLCPRKIILPPYDAVQLRKILQERVKLAFYDNVVSEDAITYSSAISAEEHGDARKALTLLKFAGEIAEQKGEEKVLEEHVRDAKKELEVEEVKKVVKTLPAQSKLVLCAVYLNEEKNREKTTGKIFEVYRRLTERLKKHTISFRHFSRLISELETLGLVRATEISRGRYGKTRIIRLEVENEIVRDMSNRYFDMTKVIDVAQREQWIKQERQKKRVKKKSSKKKDIKKC